jgi:hypothetical protein
MDHGGVGLREEKARGRAKEKAAHSTAKRHESTVRVNTTIRANTQTVKIHKPRGAGAQKKKSHENEKEIWRGTITHHTRHERT